MINLNLPFFIGIVKDEKEMYYLVDQYGIILSKEEVLEISNGLKNFAIKYGDKIEVFNQQRSEESQRKYEEFLKSKENENFQKSAYVYIFECGGKYKIGVSKDVQRRKKELDKRPYPCNIVYISSSTKYAYEVEQHIHLGLNHCRIDGEWFNISKETVEFLKEEIEIVINEYESGEYNKKTLRELRKDVEYTNMINGDEIKQ